MEQVAVLDLTDRSSFTRSIPAAYFHHLHRIISEAFLENVVDDQAQVGRAHWLRSVLDAFAEEIRAGEDFSDWRSKVLNPILVRAFYQADDFNQRHIAKQMRANRQLEGSTIAIDYWKGFYFNHDVISPVFRSRWPAVAHLNSAIRPPTEPHTGRMLFHSINVISPSNYNLSHDHRRTGPLSNAKAIRHWN